MLRFKPINLSMVDSATNDLMKTAEDLMGFKPNDALTMAGMPGLLQGVSGLIKAVYSPGRVDPGLKRLIGFMSSSVNGCQYCMAHVAGSAQNNGISAEKLSALWEYETSNYFSDRERSALDISRYGSQSPSGINDEMFMTFTKYFDEAERLEILAVVSLFGFLNRWNSIAMTEIEPESSEAWERLDTDKFLSEGPF